MKSIILIVLLLCNIPLSSQTTEGRDIEIYKHPLVSADYGLGLSFLYPLKIPSGLLGEQNSTELDWGIAVYDHIEIRFFNIIEFGIAYQDYPLTFDENKFGNLYLAPISIMLKKDWTWYYETEMPSRYTGFRKPVVSPVTLSTYSLGVGMGYCFSNFKNGEYIINWEQQQNQHCHIDFDTPLFYKLEASIGYFPVDNIQLYTSVAARFFRGQISITTDGQSEQSEFKEIGIMTDISSTWGFNFWLFY